MTASQQIRFLDNILSDTGRLTALLVRLRELARADNPDIRGSAPLETVLAALQRAFPRLVVEVDAALDHTLAISAENAEIVFTHLADNAVRHGARKLRIAVQTGEGAVSIRLSDDGNGIPEDNRARVFDAFFTTRRESGGTGMGLGIVRAMLRAHGGTIALLPAGGEGAAFEITLPTTRPM